MQRCYGCMQEFKDEYELCPHCGFIMGTQPERVNHLPYGTRLQNRYIIGKALGHGGFGITYIAWDIEQESVVAIKEFFPHSLSMRNPGETEVYCYVEESDRYFRDGIRKMMDEGKKLSRFIENENIVDVYDYFQENNTAYIVMEYLEGRDLKKYLDEVGGKLEPQAAIRIMLPVLNALADMHSDNLIHRDIAPDNIFICDDGRIKLLDFGSARLAVQDADRSLSVLIKPGYAPKEQYLSRSKQGPWTDVYASCATLYRIVTGEIPVSSTDRDVVPLKTFSQFGLRGHDALEDVIMRGMEPEIEDRIKYAQLLEKELIAVFKSYSGDFSGLKPRAIRSDEDDKKKKIIKIAAIAAAAAVGVSALAFGISAAVKHFSDGESAEPDVTSYEDTVLQVTEPLEIVTEPVVESDNVVIVRIGKMKKSQLINSVLTDAQKVYMVDIDSDGKSEIVTYTDKLNIYANLPDGSLKCTSVECSANAEIYYDKADKKIAFFDSDKSAGGIYRLNSDFFESNGKLTEEELNAMVAEGILYNASEFVESGECGEGNKWTYFTQERTLYLDFSVPGTFDFPASASASPWGERKQEVKRVIFSDRTVSVPHDICNSFGVLEEVYIGKTVEIISESAFDKCVSLKSVIMPPTVTEIGKRAFAESAITDFAIGASVNEIGENAFFGCKSLKGISADEFNKKYATDASGVLYSKDFSELIVFPAGAIISNYSVLPSTKAVRQDAFANCVNLKGVFFAKGVTHIGVGAFRDCAVLETAELPSSLRIISKSMFENCSALKDVSFPSKLETIDDMAFTNCTALEEVELPSGVTEIGAYAFANCTKIKEFEIPQSVSDVSENAFEGWTTRQTIIVNDSRRGVSDRWDKNWLASCDAQVEYKRLI